MHGKCARVHVYAITLCACVMNVYCMQEPCSLCDEAKEILMKYKSEVSRAQDIYMHACSYKCHFVVDTV